MIKLTIKKRAAVNAPNAKKEIAFKTKAAPSYSIIPDFGKFSVTTNFVNNYI